MILLPESGPVTGCICTRGLKAFLGTLLVSFQVLPHVTVTLNQPGHCSHYQLESRHLVPP